MSSEEFWMDFPDRTHIKANCPARIYSEGNQNYKNGVVEEAWISDDVINIDIETYDEDVSVKLTDKRSGDINVFCNCYTSQAGFWCWHVITAFLYVTDNLDRLKEDRDVRMESVDYFMSHISHKKILNFVSRHLKEDRDFYDLFIEKLGLQNIRLPRNYARMLDRLYSDTETQDVIFDDMFEIAREERDAGGHMEAARAYGSTAEHIITTMRDAKDDYGYYQDCAIEAIENLTDSVIRADVSSDKKKLYIKYVFERAVNPVYQAYWPYYVESLKTICTEEGDMSYWMDLTQSSSETGDAQQLASMQAFILEDAGKWDDAADALLPYYAKDADTCKHFVGILKRTDDRRALRDARKAVNAFPTDPKILDEALPIFVNAKDEYQQILRYLFEATDDWKYFFKLKEVASDWDLILDTISHNLATTAPERSVQIYVKEGMHEKAIDALEKIDNHDMCAKYLSKLAKKSPTRYFQLYGGTIQRFTKSKTGKDHYHKVMKHVENIRTIPDSEELFAKFIKSLKTNNASRRILIAMLKEAYPI